MTTMVVTSIRLWPVVSRFIFPSKLHCGCAIVAVHQPWWMIGASVLILGATALVMTRFFLSFWRHRSHSRNYARRLLSKGWRMMNTTDVSAKTMVVRLDEPIAVTLGLIQPKIFISEGLLRRLTPAEISSVIAHEHEHQRAADPLVTALMDSLLAACPWFPGARQTMSAAYSLREISADAGATDGYEEVTALSSAFVKLAEMHSEPILSAFSPNRDRLEKLLDHNWSYAHRWWSWSAIAVVTLVLVGAVTLSRAARAATPSVPQTAALCHETIVMCRADRVPVKQTGWLCLNGFCSALDRSWLPRYAITLEQ